MRAIVGVLGLLLAACFGGGGAGGGVTGAGPTGPFAAALADAKSVQWATLGADPKAIAWPERGGVLVVDGTSHHGWHCSEAMRARLVAFVQQGGRVVLFGNALALVSQLGVDEQPPECGEFRWGFDVRALQGEAQLGIQVVSAHLPELTADLPENAGVEDACLLAGGAPCTAPLATWPLGPPRQGVVLARLFTRRDGADDPLGAPVLAHWQFGAGAVLACGLVPAIDHANADIRAAARAFVQRCAKWAGNAEALLVLASPDRAANSAPSELPRMAPWVAHWGWQVGWQSEGEERLPEEIVREVLEPSWQAGADLVEFELSGPDRAVPMSWRSDDPLKPAPSFESRAEPRRFDASSFRALAAESHMRSMLALGVLDPLPVGERAVERLATLRFLARELACVRRYPDSALDGFGFKRWLPDDQGLSLAMVGDFAPGAMLYRLGEQAPPIVGGVRVQDADDGVLRGVPFPGLTASWRDGFDRARFRCGVLDARARPDAHGDHFGGASTGDWLVAQANDFVRKHRGQGAAMWWRRHDQATFDRDTEAYVHGLSLEPLRAAVAMGLAATGRNGLRAAAAALQPGTPASYHTAVDAPAAVHTLQNNWFRLLGSGGAFTFDPSGLADFGAGAMPLATGFLRTRLFGGRPDGNALRGDRTDFLAAGMRGEGGYGRTLRVGGSEGSDPLAPAMLAMAAAPAWPQTTAFEWSSTVGCHELELLLRPVRGRGVLQVSLDGVVLAALSFDVDVRPEPVRVPVHVAQGGVRLLTLGLVHGGSVALDRAVVARVGDVGVEAVVVEPAGNRAVLRETSQSSYHHETVQLTTLADFPGFVLDVHCERAVRNLQVERTFAFLDYTELAAVTSGDDRRALRQPFVLRSKDARRPDVVVVPLNLLRNESLELQPDGLSWRTMAEPGSRSRIGILLCARGDGPHWLASASMVLGNVAEPLRLELGAGGEAQLRSELPQAWTRVVHVAGAAATPFLVREQGQWFWRGSMPNADGGRWLRVHHHPGDAITIVGGASVLARTRPGPGSLRSLLLRDPEPAACTVQVLQTSPLTMPSVVMGSAFDEVKVDGESWAFFADRRVFLPNTTGTFTIATTEHAGSASPHVLATRAPLTTCRWLAAERTLLLSTPGDPDRPAELAWTAVLAGPVPTSIENGEVVDDASLRLPDIGELAAAKEGGVLIRFRNGTTRVRYGD